MARAVRFLAPRAVDLVELPDAPLPPGSARVRTLVTGISAGTELTAYRGTNPYLTASWDADLRLFAGPAPDGPAYPLVGWGYSEVGTVVELGPGPEVPGDVQVGDVVWGIWGHREEAVLPRERLRGHRLPDGLDPVVGCFARVGAVALNAVLAADAALGETVVVVGQGVIGLLATAFAAATGAHVVAVDALAPRRGLATAYGASEVHPPGAGLAAALRTRTRGRGADVAVELSGSYAALHEAVRLVGPDGRVVAAGFYQGGGQALRLGEEFHHNRVEVLASQIGAVPLRKRGRWDTARLHEVVLDRLAAGSPDVTRLVTHRFPLEDAAQAYALLDADPGGAVQVVLDVAPAGAAA